MRFVVVRVIDERAGLIGDEAVDEVSARRHERLRDAGDAVHRDGDVVNAVQMDRVRRRVVVRVIDDERDRLVARRAPGRERRRCRCSPSRSSPGLSVHGAARSTMWKILRASARLRDRLIRAVGAPEDSRLAGRRRRNRNRPGDRLKPGAARRDDVHVVGVGERDGRQDRRQQRGEHGEEERPQDPRLC